MVTTAERGAITAGRRAPTPDELAFVAARRFARLATADAEGQPAVVPVCYALIETGDALALVIPLDEKPKRVPLDRLKRVRNLRENPAASLVVDDTDEDWSRLAFVQLNGAGRIVQPGEPGFSGAITALRAKYWQYQTMAIEGRPLIWIDVQAAASWRGGGEASPRPRDLAALIQGRRSVRAMRPDPVPSDLVRQAIAAAGWAPSPHGRQPWRFAVVERRERKAALAAAMAATWQEQLELDGQEAAVVRIRLAKSRERVEHAPVLVVPCLYLADLDLYPDPIRQAAETTMAIQSLGAAIQNLLLAAYASGLDGGWMCAPLFCPDVVRDALGLDAALIPHALIPLGFAAKDPIRRPRRPLDDLIVDWQ